MTIKTSSESAQEVKKYLKKLQLIVKGEAVFVFFKSRLLNKARIDDVLCCIEASFPDEYKDAIRKRATRNLKTYRYYTQLVVNLKKKFAFSSNLYLVKPDEVQPLISAILAGIDSDIRMIINDPSSMQ